MSSLAPEAAVEILDGTLQEVREQLNALPDGNRRVRAFVWQNASATGVNPGANIGPREQAAIAYLEERLRHPLTDPAEIEQAEADQRELRLRLHQNRIDAGEVSVRPDDIVPPQGT